LVANGARSFASGLAGSRAFTAAAGAESFVQHSFINSFDMFTHSKYLPNKLSLYLFYRLSIVYARNFYCISKSLKIFKSIPLVWRYPQI
jgi:hypothetical protein